MNKIIEVALTGKFGAEAVTNLMEVIGATPNPQMATEILLDIYVKPEIPNKVVNAQGMEKTAVYVDYWQGTISYSYDEEVTRHLYVDKDTDTSVITVDNYNEYKRDYEVPNTKSFYLSTGEIKNKQGNCDFADWLFQEAVVVG
jgi:hypothetical protein